MPAKTKEGRRQLQECLRRRTEQSPTRPASRRPRGNGRPQATSGRHKATNRQERKTEEERERKKLADHRHGSGATRDPAESAQEATKSGPPARTMGRTHGRGQPSEMVSGKVAVRVGVAGVSSAVAMESSLPSGMGPGGLAAEGRSKGCLGRG